MQILHLDWINKAKGKNFFLWGEASRETAAKKRAATAKHTLHSFCSTKKELGNIFKTIAKDIKLRDRCDKLALSLPTFNKYPLPSSNIIFKTEEEQFDARERKTEISQFKVNGMWLMSYECFSFLISITNSPIKDEVILGADIYFWSEVSKFTMELLAKQRFLPALRMNRNNLEAVWKPIINRPQDEERLNILCQAMPSVCRAHEKGYLSEKDIILDFLSTIVDEMVRESVKDKFYMDDNLPSVWLNALASKDRIAKGTSHQKEVLREGVTNWIATIESQTQKQDFRTCFRLEEPSRDRGDSKWRLSFYLQGISDRSLSIPTRDIWQKGNVLRHITKIWGNPQSRFLEDLARSTMLFPPIEISLHEPSPAECSLNINEAHSFLKEGAYLLQESGYGVLVPAWWERGKARKQLGVKLSVSPPSNSSYFAFNEVVDFNWEMAIGNISLTAEELERLVQLKASLVQVRGEWIEINPQDIQKAHKYLQKLTQEGMTFKDALRMGLGYEEPGLPVTEFVPQGWLGDFIKGGDGSNFEKIPVPKGLQGRLRSYQEVGLSWLAYLRDRTLGGCLADDMGLGKTVQLISLILYDRQRKKRVKPALIICPTSVVGNWQKEVAKFAPSLKVMVHHGSERLAGKKFLSECKKQDMVVSTYSLVHRDKEHLEKVEWEGIILDEAQKIKNPATKQAHAVRNLQGEYRMVLTGTPIENRLSELWSIMEFLNPGYLGSQSEFKEKFALPIERYSSENHSARLRQLIQPFLLRRLKTDKSIIKDLPEKNEMKIYCPLTKEQVSLYKVIVDEMLGKIESSRDIERKGLILAALTKLKQICNHPALFLHDKSLLDERSGKLTRLTEMIEEVVSIKEKALIFTQFSEMGDLLKNYLQKVFGKEILFLYGGVPRKHRDVMIEKFQSDTTEFPVFILSVRAGGLGLNLTGASYVFHFDRWWNPAVENQATDRAFRIGQTKNVQVYKYICSGTLEEQIDKMIEAKKELARNIIEISPKWITELSNQKLRDIFTLREEKVG